MKKLISIIAGIVMTVSIFTAASASASTGSTYAGLMSAVQAEKKADDGKQSEQRGKGDDARKQEEVPKKPEDEARKQEEAPKKAENKAIQKEEALQTIAWVKVLEKELRETVIKDAMERFKRASGRSFPINFFKQNIDKTVEDLTTMRIRSNLKVQEYYRLLKILNEKFKFITDPVLIIKIEILKSYFRQEQAHYRDLTLGYDSLIGAKLRFNYKV